MSGCYNSDSGNTVEYLVDSDSDYSCDGAIGSMWGVKSASPHVEQNTHTPIELDCNNILSSPQNSGLETVHLETLNLNSMSSGEESSSSEDMCKIKRRSRRSRWQSKLLRKVDRIEKTQQVMVEYLSKVSDSLEKLDISPGSGGYPHQRRIKMDIKMIKFLQGLGQSSVTAQERVKIDQLVRDMKDEVGQVVKDLDQELKEAETELSGPVKERTKGKEKKGEKSKKPSRDEAELTDTVEIEVKSHDLVKKANITTIETSSDENSCTQLSSGGDSDGDDDRDGGDTRMTNGQRNGDSQEIEKQQSGVSQSMDSGREQHTVKSLDLAYHHIVCEAARQGNRYYCELCKVSFYDEKYVQTHVKSVTHKRKMPDLKEQVENSQTVGAKINGQDVETPRPKRKGNPEEQDDSRRKVCRLQGCKRFRTEEFLGFCTRDCLESAVETKRLKQ